MDSAIALTTSETTNYIAIANDSEARPRFKCFTWFLAQSYQSCALFAQPTLYVDILEHFWRSAIWETITPGNDGEKINITCQIGNVHTSFDTTDMNKVLNLSTKDFDVEPINQQVIEFF